MSDGVVLFFTLIIACFTCFNSSTLNMFISCSSLHQHIGQSEASSGEWLEAEQQNSGQSKASSGEWLAPENKFRRVIQFFSLTTHSLSLCLSLRLCMSLHLCLSLCLFTCPASLHHLSLTLPCSILLCPLGFDCIFQSLSLGLSLSLRPSLCLNLSSNLSLCLSLRLCFCVCFFVCQYLSLQFSFVSFSLCLSTSCR